MGERLLTWSQANLAVLRHHTLQLLKTMHDLGRVDQLQALQQPKRQAALQRQVELLEPMLNRVPRNAFAAELELSPALGEALDFVVGDPVALVSRGDLLSEQLRDALWRKLVDAFRFQPPLKESDR